MDWFEKGTPVCIVGLGTAEPLHRHTVVERLTATMIVTASGRRYRRSDLLAVGASTYGGSRIAARCQRPPKASPTS